MDSSCGPFGFLDGALEFGVESAGLPDVGEGHDGAAGGGDDHLAEAEEAAQERFADGEAFHCAEGELAFGPGEKSVAIKDALVRYGEDAGLVGDRADDREHGRHDQKEQKKRPERGHAHAACAKETGHHPMGASVLGSFPAAMCRWACDPLCDFGAKWVGGVIGVVDALIADCKKLCYDRIVPLNEKRFVHIVRRFCFWAESSNHDAAVARELLLELLLHVNELRSTISSEAYSAYGFEGLGPEVAENLRDLPFQYYLNIFSPLDLKTGSEAVIGDIADDLVDTYGELRYGLKVYDSGNHDGAERHWFAAYLLHWGHHASSAVRVLDEYYRSQSDFRRGAPSD